MSSLVETVPPATPQPLPVDDVVNADAAKTVPGGVSAGPGDVTTSKLGVVFLTGPLIHLGVKRGRAPLPAVISAMQGRMFVEQHNILYVDRQHQRLRAAASLDSTVRKNPSLTATAEEKDRQHNARMQKNRFARTEVEKVVNKLKGCATGCLVHPSCDHLLTVFFFLVDVCRRHPGPLRVCCHTMGGTGEASG